MPMFRKKPVVIEAWQFNGEDRWDWPDFIKEHDGVRAVMLSTKPKVDAIDIVTLEGTMRADQRDWIIRGVQGEIYPCKPDIFAATYEPA